MLASLQKLVGLHRRLDGRVFAMPTDHLIGAGPQLPPGNHSKNAPIAMIMQIPPTARNPHSPAVIGGASLSGCGKGMDVSSPGSKKSKFAKARPTTLGHDQMIAQCDFALVQVLAKARVTSISARLARASS